MHPDLVMITCRPWVGEVVRDGIPMGGPDAVIRAGLHYFVNGLSVAPLGDAGVDQGRGPAGPVEDRGARAASLRTSPPSRAMDCGGLPSGLGRAQARCRRGPIEDAGSCCAQKESKRGVDHGGGYSFKVRCEKNCSRHGEFTSALFRDRMA